MSRIFIAWELGENYGHLARCLAIAESLRQRGHGVVFAVRDTHTAAELLTPAGFSFVQAPLVGRKTRMAKPPANYAELLLASGYADPAVLSGMVGAWLTLLELGRPDAVLADHAPTALLAADMRGIPHLAIGNGFAVPPDVSPLPSIRPWESIATDRLARADSAVDAAITGAAAAHGNDSPLTLRNLFGSHDLLDTFAELDHYPERRGGNYIGPIISLGHARRVAWKESGCHRILAYLRPDMLGFAPLMETLRKTDAETICVIPGLSLSQAKRLAGPRLRISLLPLALSPLLDTTNLTVSYGSSGTCSAALLSGTPLLLLPRFVEQYLFGTCIETIGAGVQVAKNRTRDAIADAMSALLNNPRYTACARRFADKYAGFLPQQAVTHVVAALESCATCTPVRQPIDLNV